jgi:hypothetical protein
MLDAMRTFRNGRSGCSAAGLTGRFEQDMPRERVR